jgi:tRNA(fMet)-specific endonuclease VapC
MNRSLVADTNAVIDFIRQAGVLPAPLTLAETIFVPLPVVGELFTGAYASKRTVENVGAVERTISNWTVLLPDLETARVYGRIRAVLRSLQSVSQGRMNDLWIAALCIQHATPLVTNDRGFDSIPDLQVIHW